MTNEIALPGNQRTGSQGTVIEQTRAAAEVAAAVAVARQFPRDPNTAVAAMRELCGRLSVAQRAFYEVPNRGAGMSVHIARELALIWRNIDHGVRELARDDLAGESEMSVWALDIENNVRSTRSFIQPHQKSLKGGKRQKLEDLNDIYLNNQNTGARAVREALFTVIPGWFLADAEAMLKQTLLHGDGVPIEERRTSAVEKFANIDIDQDRMEKRIGKPLEKWAPQDLATLARIYTSITIDGIKAAEFFPEQAVQVTVAQPTLDTADPTYEAPEADR
jgi:hypothetical protein